MVTVAHADGSDASGHTDGLPPLPRSPFADRYDPVAHASSQVVGKRYRLTVLTPNLIRYEYSPDGLFEDRASAFAVHRALPPVEFQRVDRSDGGVEIHTSALHVEYDGKPFSPSGFTVMLKATSERKVGHVGSA
jgi:hypothetical protein